MTLPTGGGIDDCDHPSSLRTTAISKIRHLIWSGSLAPDHTFSEVTMSEQLQMSRAPVREALVVLSYSGWVDAVPRVGYRVRGMTLNEIRDLYSVRAAVEPHAAAAAARRAPHDRDAVDALMDYTALEVDAEASVDALVTGRYRFHRRLARLSANPEFDRVLEDVLLRCSRYYLLSPVSSMLRREPVLRGPLAEAVVAGEADAAAQAMASILSDEQRRLTEAIIDSDLIRAVKLSSVAPPADGEAVA